MLLLVAGGDLLAGGLFRVGHEAAFAGGDLAVGAVGRGVLHDSAGRAGGPIPVGLGVGVATAEADTLVVTRSYIFGWLYTIAHEYLLIIRLVFLVQIYIINFWVGEHKREKMISVWVEVHLGVVPRIIICQVRD